MSDKETPKGEGATNTNAEIDPEDIPKERVRKLDEEITLSDTCCYKCVEEMREPLGLPIWIFTILLSICNFVGILIFVIKRRKTVGGKALTEAEKAELDRILNEQNQH